MIAWFRRNYSKLQFGFRMTLAALLSYGLGQALGLHQTYWAVLSAVIVMQGSVGGSLRMAINRMIGTIGGAIWGAVVAIAIPHSNDWSLALALFAAIGPLAVVTAFRPDYRVAPTTAIIVLMGAVLQQADPLSSAVSRVFEISLGSAVAIGVALFILPARAHRLLARAGSSVLAAMAELATVLAKAAAHGLTADALLVIQQRLRAAIAQTEARAEEAKVERANRLSDGPDPEPLPRTLRRLRHDLAMLARALHTPFANPVLDRLGGPMQKLFEALASALTELSKALAAGGEPPNLEEVRSAAANYKAAVSEAERDGTVFKAGSEDTHRVFAVLFLFEQLQQNLQDLCDRVLELRQIDPHLKKAIQATEHPG